MTKYLLIAIAILGSALFVTSKQMISNKKDADRIELAYKQAEDDNKILNLELSELKDRQSSRIKELSDSLKIKPKFIDRYVEIKIHDTVTITDTVYKELDKIGDGLYAVKEDTACFGVEGVINVRDSIPTFALTKVSYDNDAEYLVYLERRRMKWWIFKYKSLTKKDAKLEVISECGTINVEDVKIIK